MVDVGPKPQADIIALKAPKSSVSEADVKSPWLLLANNLEKVGEGLNTLAETQAREAGVQAVHTDDDGRLVVDKAPIIGPASQVYARAARTTALARMEPEIENRMTQLRLQHRGDPLGFKTAADEYVGSLNVQDPVLQSSIQNVARSNAGTNYRSAMLEADHLNQQNNYTSLQARLKTVTEETASLARQGGTETPEYKAREQSVVEIYRALAGDPRNNYPQARVDAELGDWRGNNEVQSIIGDVARKYQTRQNYAEARKELQDRFFGPGSEKLNIPIAKKEHAVIEGVRALEAMDATDKASMAEFRKAVTEYQNGVMRNPGAATQIEFNNVLQRAHELNDQKSIQELNALQKMVPFLQSVKTSNPVELIPAFKQMQQGFIPDPVAVSDRLKHGMDVLQSKGISKVAAAGIFGNLFQESSSLNPAESHDQGIGVGIAGWNRERRVALQNFAREHGTDEKDFGTQVEFLYHELTTSPDPGVRRAWAELQAAKTPEEAALAMIHYERPAGYRPDAPQLASGFVNRINNTRAVFAGQPIGGQSIAAVDPATMRLMYAVKENMRAQIAKSAEPYANNIVERLTNKREAVTTDEIETFTDMVVAADRQDLVPRVTDAIQSYAKFKQIQDASGLTKAVEDQIRAKIASGIDPVQRKLLETTLDMAIKDEEAKRKDPLSWGATAGQIKPIGELNVGDPRGAAAELHERDVSLAKLRQRNIGIGPNSVIGEREGRDIANALTTGPVDQAREFLTNMATSLSPETYRATMASKEVHAAVNAMAHSTDPARLSVGMSTLDHLYRTDPNFSKQFGGETVTRLQAWQARRGTMTQQQIAEWLNRADDPAQAAARKEARETAETEMKAVKTQDVVNKFGSFFERNVPFFNAEAGTAAAPDVAQGALLAAEYRERVIALRAYGVDPDTAQRQAQEGMERDWKRSEVNGGRVMKNRPEDSPYYQPINGSYRWMTDGLRGDLIRRLGPEHQVEPGRRFPSQTNWKLAGVVADATTEAELRDGKQPPSYLVAITTANGATDYLHEPDGRLTRYRWDRGPAVQGAIDDFTRIAPVIRDLKNSPFTPLQ